MHNKGLMRERERGLIYHLSHSIMGRGGGRGRGRGGGGGGEVVQLFY